MLKRLLLPLLALSILSSFSYSQKLKKADKAILSNLQAHIRFLADDKLEGRRAGSNGERLAREYISKQFAAIGLSPKGTDSLWYQPFEIYDGKQVNAATHMIVNGNDLKLNSDYFPLVFSPNKGLEAAASVSLPESGVPWFIDIKEILQENKENPHFDLPEAIRLKANSIAAKGATALIVFNTSSIDDNLSFNSKDRSEASSIPVFYLKKEAKQKFMGDESAMIDMKLKTEIGPKNRTGNNVIGYIDNKAATTVIVGAHYDHLGYGEDGNSMIRTNERNIHNGADDNASGTAALIELARLLKQSRNKSHNYLFIAFSAEELGLNGSKYFADNPTIDLNRINYMVNMDMVGRLNDSARALTIGGYGTSPEWGRIFSNASGNKNFKIKFDSSGTGPSDHTSFYRKKIPVLFFFTGLHTDYHKPSDDADKINYNGELLIIKLIQNVIEQTNGRGKLVFNTTREVQMGTTARFSVTLGIMPDYSFSGSGVRVDGVSDGRPAQKSGLKSGDVIIQLGDHSTTSVESYMQALSKFKKGDTTKLKYKRGNEILETDVQF